ncbi:MAG: hypothetical protein EA405_05470 [Rhodospirillales bacterium]|nr:MAG: hypothetical protein EA405_05470 [Rhodospirillales bacterium]
MATASNRRWTGGLLIPETPDDLPPGTAPLAGPAPAAGAGWAALFLSLMLLILAFFVVLVSISQIDAVRSVGVMGSVAEAFAAAKTDGDTSPPAGAARGDVVDGADLEQSLQALFATELAIAPTDADVAGRMATLTLAAEALFRPGRAEVRDRAGPLLDRIAAAMADRPAGLGVRLDIVVGTAVALAAATPDPGSLAIRRATALAEDLVRRGVHRHWVTVGLQPGAGDRVVLGFAPRIRTPLHQTAGGNDPAPDTSP